MASTGRPGHQGHAGDHPLHSYILLQDKKAMSEAVANVRSLIAAGMRDLQAMLDELGKLQTGLPRDAPAPDEPDHDD
jgi:hypothetical protein